MIIVIMIDMKDMLLQTAITVAIRICHHAGVRGAGGSRRALSKPRKLCSTSYDRSAATATTSFNHCGQGGRHRGAIVAFMREEKRDGISPAK